MSSRHALYLDTPDFTPCAVENVVGDEASICIHGRLWLLPWVDSQFCECACSSWLTEVARVDCDDVVDNLGLVTAKAG